MSRTVTLSEFIRSECANFCAGECIGVSFLSAGRCAKTRTGKCGLLAFKGGRCQFFERAVLPIAEKRRLDSVIEAYGRRARHVTAQDGGQARGTSRQMGDEIKTG